MYANLLIPTDRSELAGKAAQHGIALAQRIGAKVTALAVLQPFHMFTTNTQMIETRRLSTKHARVSTPRKPLARSFRQRKQPASHLRRFMWRMSIPTTRSSIPRRRKAVA